MGGLLIGLRSPPGRPACERREAPVRAGRLTRDKRVSAGFGSGGDHANMAGGPTPPRSPLQPARTRCPPCGLRRFGRTTNWPRPMTNRESATTMASQNSAHVATWPILVQAWSWARMPENCPRADRTRGTPSGGAPGPGRPPTAMSQEELHGKLAAFLPRIHFVPNRPIGLPCRPSKSAATCRAEASQSIS